MAETIMIVINSLGLGFMFGYIFAHRVRDHLPQEKEARKKYLQYIQEAENWNVKEPKL